MERLRALVEDYDIRRGAGFLLVSVGAALVAWLVYPMTLTGSSDTVWATVGGFYAALFISACFLLGAIGSVLAAGIRALTRRAHPER